ncbi:50S ribosomal protein L14e [Candidatus Bathyarchaeota archaeon]|nr:MAG: 50S ribosomal protein L14e [Candidatus Bathyarchaeota archaeon]
MVIPEVGRVCIKKTGREAGRQCVVVDIIDKNFVLVTGPKKITGVRRRRCNVDHLEPTDLKISIKRGADDEEVAKALLKVLGKTGEEVEKSEEAGKKPRRRKRKKETGEGEG